MTTIQIDLPDKLAREAQSAGLLSSARLEQWLRDELAARRVDELFDAMDRMAAVPDPGVMSREEVTEEIAAMGAERRARSLLTRIVLDTNVVASALLVGQTGVETHDHDSDQSAGPTGTGGAKRRAAD